MRHRTPWRAVQILCAFALLFSMLGIPGAATPLTLADHTAAPTRVTVPGSFNSELGCTATSSNAGGDWEPGCTTNPGVTPVTPTPPEGNDLQDQGNEVWARTLGPIPAGNYEFKIALNGAWDQNYGSDFQQNGPNFTLNLTTTTSVRFFYDHKTHYIANSFANTIYTVPGDFNSELGCSGDWLADCLRTLMSDVDADGVYTFRSEAIPAGNYEFKVATNEDWGNPNYGDNGNNVPFTVGEDTAEVVFSFDTADNTVGVEVIATTPPPPPPAEDAALIQPPVSDPINQGEIFYFVMPDRFANGEPSNDRGGIAGDDPLQTGFLPTNKGYYHGGDLAGLQANLDYIQNLGVTAIWMTPMFKNKPVQCDRTKEPSIDDCSAGYHGYWPLDFTQIAPHFGTNAEMTAFVEAAQGRGMRVFFDIITNHTADVIVPEDGNTTYVSRAAAPYRDAGGNIFDDRDFLFAERFPTMNRFSFPRRPFFPDPADATAKTPSWLNDPTMYHNRGNAAFDGSEGDLYGDFVGLDGLFTERPEVVQGMVDIHKFWISEFGIDGFRVDTVKHVNMEFWQQFVPAIRAHAAAEGKPEFFIFGEVFDGNPAVLSRFTREGEFPAILDFDFNYSVGDFATTSAGPGRLQGLFRGDDFYTTAEQNAYNLPTFLGNHDVGRLGNRLRTPQDPDDELRVKRILLGYGVMFTARGVPIIYYGDEQGFTGNDDGNDKDARQNMFPSQVASYNAEDLIGTDKTTADDNFDPTHPLYLGLTDLAALRTAHPALQVGAQIERLAEGDASGVYAFSRIDREQQVEYVVAANNATTERTVTIPTFAADTTFAAIYGAEGAVVTGANGRMQLTVPALSVVVYQQQSEPVANLAPTAAPIGPAISLTGPVSGTVVLGTGLIEVAASVAGNAFAEVSFAVSVDGAPFQHLGTDTNAPYRVFFDPQGLPAGAELTFKAVVTDLLGAEGNFNSATSIVTLGVPPVCTVEYEFAVIHYYREDGNYDDWGLHLWGDAIADEEATDWNEPKPFLGRTDYGAFAWVRLKDPTKPVNFIVHQPGGDSVPDTRDPGGDRSFIPQENPQIFLKGGDAAIYASQAEAQGFITVHYNRPDGIYDGWGVYVFGDGVDPSEQTAWPANRPFTGTDDFGRFVRIQLTDATKQVGVIVMNNGVKDTEPDRTFIPSAQPALWVNSGDEANNRSLSQALNVATLRYHRPAGDYGDFTSTNFNDFWGLHLWAGTLTPNPAWETPFKPNLPQDSFGIGFQVELEPDAPRWAYILHRGNEKDQETDQFLDLNGTGHEIWVLQNMPGSYPYIVPVEAGCTLGQGNAVSKQRAHWVSQNTLAWPILASSQVEYALHYAPNGGMSVVDGAVQGGTSVPLTLAGSGLTGAVATKFPHLAGNDHARLTHSLSADQIKAILRGQVWVSARNDQLGLIEVTGVQIPGVLDDLYAQAAAALSMGVNYGALELAQAITLRLWAPTAQEVNLLLFDTAVVTTPERLAMTHDDASGSWSIELPTTREDQFYLYEVNVFVPSTGQVEINQVTDPYAISLATNSTRSQIVNLNNAALKPSGWDATAKPTLEAFEDVVLYELHVRDFSITDESVPLLQRGTFKAFTQRNSNGMRHLRELAEDGLTHIHLLPVFDIATINEDRTARTELLDRFPELRALSPDSEEQQRISNEVRNLDGFNWGYDPFHYNVPEGSYSTDPNGTPRILEFREMVQALNENGLRVVMDVVYNHTNAAGQAEKSVLDRVVPGYYHRLNADGVVETSTCCPNTATEHAMMERLMIESLVLWAREYKVDGFRFDLMGHHTRENMLNVRAALDALTLAKDGVDGAKIMLYGEGWNFGEVADGRRGINATQRNMAGTGIATFSDRLRDAVRGGGPFDSGEGARRQGFATGLFTDPNDLNQGSEADQRNNLLDATDLIRVGLTGNLAFFPLENRTGRVVNGEDVTYNGAPGGYTLDPQEVITYVEAHDNETLFDAVQLKAPAAATLADRVRMHNLGVSVAMLGQGIPFFQAGQDLLRSKSGDRNSYDSGDWFNRIDWMRNEHGWGSGLPPQGENNNNWGVLRSVLVREEIKPGRAELDLGHYHFREMLQIRKSSPLFRLRTAEEVIAQVSFMNTGADQIPGLIVMRITDNGARDLDPQREQIVVLFNAAPEPVSFTAETLRDAQLRLHPIQGTSVDTVVRSASFDPATGTFAVPGRATVVFTDERTQIFMPIAGR
ncbi:pullulanase-type alpha-1,6-glucosidase [Candidatus Chloroploca sp. M-50]|uniref:pullulanase n=1 Tax=Candidatus Chloroploca mongolica TaxID=2528176 RepID=A0ABS4DAY8_9CHLR|nr:pullulanase-type alpha-1,6-glucosidase [Candidatus Chloroploca mongolica]MBP1466597.1 pullulanase-type alpha-1,6-glucosidase [Candidatus Chloroploca mongolica]